MMQPEDVVSITYRGMTIDMGPITLNEILDDSEGFAMKFIVPAAQRFLHEIEEAE